jgi:type IV pilus assembly protein PilV
MKRPSQSGMFLLEALISILIFSLGILGMVAMSGTAMSAQSDAEYRAEATNLAAQISSNILLNVDRTNFTTSLPTFEHLRTNAGTCNFAGTASTNPTVLNWIDEIRGAVPGVAGLPGATNTSESIAVNMANHNQVTITICWKPPASSASPFSPWHQHVLVTYVNLN